MQAGSHSAVWALVRLSYALAEPYLCRTLGCRFYWGCDPISYAQRALAINEFSAPRWQNLKTATGESVGNTILDQRGIPHEQWWIWCMRLPYATPSSVAKFKIYGMQSYKY